MCILHKWKRWSFPRRMFDGFSEQTKFCSKCGIVKRRVVRLYTTPDKTEQ